MAKETEATIIPQKLRVFYDVYADLPVAGMSEGELAYATDRLVFYRWDGAAWQPITLHMSSGVIADIPAAADLPNGSLYYATDDNELSQVQAGAWQVINPDVVALIGTHAALATGVHGVGGSTLQSLIQINTLIATHAGEVDPHGDRAYADGIVKTIATGSYGGNDTGGRQITTGFKCSLVIIARTGAYGWTLIPSNSIEHKPVSAYHADLTGTIALHASDGFTLGNDLHGANKSGDTFYWWAISE